MSSKRESPEPVKQALSSFLARHIFPHYTIAFSGGLDSCVLLHALSQQVPSSRIQAVYIDHQLQTESALWISLNQQFCENISIEFISLKASVDTSKSSLESQARQARYELLWQQTRELSSTFKKKSCLMTAHHLNDNAENFILRLMRGAGVKGLSSMATFKEIAEHQYLARPLLGVSRKELAAYAEAHELSYIDDPSNQDTKHRRNFVRHNIIPTLENTWPQAIQRINASMGHLSEADELLKEVACEDLSECLQTQEILNVEKLQSMSLPRQNNLLRFWLEQLQEAMPNSDVMAQIQSQLLTLHHESNATIKLLYGDLRRFRERIFYIHRNVQTQIDDLYSAMFVESKIVWNLSKPLRLTEGFELNKNWINEHYPNLCSDEKVELSLRQEGDNKLRVHLDGHEQSKQLKKYIQELKVEPWLRNKVVLLWHGAKVVGVITPDIDYGARQYF